MTQYGNSLNLQTDGLVKRNIGAFSTVTVTQHDVLVGAASNGITNVAPSATSGVPLISQGAAADPAFGTVVVAGGGTGATTLTGLVIGNGTSAMTASAITQHDVLVGGTSNAVTSVAPSATSGVPLISQGASADPAFGTAVVAGGGTGVASATAYAVLCGGTTTTGAFQSIASVGTSGQVLTSNGAGALPTFQGAGSLVLISSQTASNSTLIAFTSGISATYNNYLLLISNFLPITAGASLELQLSTNGGSTYVTTGYVGGLIDVQISAGTTWAQAGATTFAYCNTSNATTQPAGCGAIFLQNVTGGSYFQSHGTTTINNNSSGAQWIAFVSSSNSTTTTNAFKVFCSSGNISAGTFTLFGILE